MPRDVGLFAPLRSPLFRRFFLGQGVSQLGDSVFFVALQWQVISTGGGPAEVGWVGGAYMGAQVALLLAGGVIVDRFPRRLVLVTSDVLQGLAAAALALVAFSGLATFPALVAFAAFFGAAQAFAMPALGAYVPETVPPSLLTPANSLYQGTRTVSMIAGPALAAALIALAGTGAAFALNAASFAVSAALLASARAPPRLDVPPVAPRGSPLRDVKDGIRYVARHPWLWITILVFTVFNAAEAGPRNAVLPVFAARDLGAGVNGLALLLSAHATGALVGFLALGTLPPVKRRGLVGYASIVVTGLTLLGLAFATTLWQALLLAAVRGVTFATFGIMWETSVQDQVDERVRGRVLSLDMLGSFALLPFAIPLAGAIGEAFGARATFLVASFVLFACGLVGLAYRPARGFTARERT